MAGNESKELREERYIAALLTNATIKDAAAACGVSERTMHNRLNDPAFRARYDTARLEALRQSSAYLQVIVGEAIQKMYEIMLDPDTAPQIQLNAATAIVRAQQTMTEQTDVLTQLAELKEAVFHEQQ